MLVCGRIMHYPLTHMAFTQLQSFRHLIAWSKDQISLTAYKHCYRHCQQDTKSGRRPALRETCGRRCTQGRNQLLICITECHRKHQATTCEHHMTNNLTNLQFNIPGEKEAAPKLSFLQSSCTLHWHDSLASERLELYLREFIIIPIKG